MLERVGSMPGVMRFQLTLTRRSVENILPLITLPLATLTSVAIFTANGRPDLAPYGVVSATLTTIGQMGFFIGSEIVVSDRAEGVLEAISIVPTPYAAILFARVSILGVLGCIGFLESVAIAKFIFGIDVALDDWPSIAGLLLATALGTAATCLITAPLFALGKSVRTLQNGIAAPLYLLSGVLVPASVLPAALQLPSHILYLSWGADGLRAALGSGTSGIVASILAIVALALLSGLIGYFLTENFMARLQQRGKF